MDEASLAVKCAIDHRIDYLRAYIGPAEEHELEACYRALVVLAIKYGYRGLLIVGDVAHDQTHRQAVRKAVITLGAAAAPSELKIAFVPQTNATLKGYREAEAEADKRGLPARIFFSEEDAVLWLTGPGSH